MHDTRCLLDRRDTPDGEALLYAHDIDGNTELELVSGGVLLMATYNAESSRELVRLGLRAHGGDRLRVLIGGLGLGYSLREALDAPEVERVDVVEVAAPIIEWNDAPALRGVNRGAIADPRAHVIHGDFIAHVRQAPPAAYDVICMDIDNGPMLLTREANRDAYAASFLGDVRRALSAGGAFVIWSCGEDDALRSDMRRTFRTAGVKTVMEAFGKREQAYYLYWGIA